MKMAAKKKTKTYFTPLFKVNGYKADDVQKQSQLTVNTHMLAHNKPNTISTKESVQPKPNMNDPFILVQSFMDDNGSTPYVNNTNNNINKHNYNSTNNSINSNNSSSNNLNIEITTVQSFVHKENDLLDDNQITASPMHQSHSNGFTNIFKKSVKKLHDSTHETLNSYNNVDLPHSDNTVKKTNSFKKFYHKTKGKRKSSCEVDNVSNTEKNIDNFINYTPDNPSFPVRLNASTSPSTEFKYSFRNKSFSSTSSTRPQQSSFNYLNDDSYLNSTQSLIATPIGTPFSTHYDTFDGMLSTPNANDDLEVCSINTSSTKRFKTLRRSNSIMSVNSNASMQLATPNSTTSQFTSNNNSTSFNMIPVSPIISSSSNILTSSNFTNNNINNQSRMTTTINTSNSRSRMKSVSSNISSNQNYYQHSTSSTNLPLSLNASPSVKMKPATPTLQLQKPRSRSSSGHLSNLRSSTPSGIQSNSKIGLDTVLTMMEKQHQQQRQNNSQPHTPQYISQSPLLQIQQASPSSKKPISTSVYATPLTDNRMHQIVLEQEKQILNQKLHHNDPQILENLMNEFVDLPSDVDLGLGLDMEDIETNGIEKSVGLQLDDTDLEQTELLPKELDDLINIIRLEDLSKQFGH